MNGITAQQHYRQVSTQGAVTDANPHQLILMLLDGANEKISIAQGKMIRGEVAEKGRLSSGAIAIIETLSASLDHGAGGELASNLERLYDYMARRLLQSNANNSSGHLREVSALLKEVREAWVAIPQDHHQLDRPAGATAPATGVAQ